MSVDIQFNVDQALSKLGELVAKHGPHAIDLAAQVVRVDAAGGLVNGAVDVAAAGVLGWGAVILWKLFKRLSAEEAKATHAWIKDHTGTLSMPDGPGWLLCIPASIS